MVPRPHRYPTFSPQLTDDFPQATKRSLNVGIVGAGLGGLAAAIAIARAGCDVTILEAAAELGEVGSDSDPQSENLHAKPHAWCSTSTKGAQWSFPTHICAAHARLIVPSVRTPANERLF